MTHDMSHSFKELLRCLRFGIKEVVLLIRDDIFGFNVFGLVIFLDLKFVEQVVPRAPPP